MAKLASTATGSPYPDSTVTTARRTTVTWMDRCSHRLRDGRAALATATAAATRSTGNDRSYPWGALPGGLPPKGPNSTPSKTPTNQAPAPDRTVSRITARRLDTRAKTATTVTRPCELAQPAVVTNQVIPLGTGVNALTTVW